MMNLKKGLSEVESCVKQMLTLKEADENVFSYYAFCDSNLEAAIVSNF